MYWGSWEETPRNTQALQLRLGFGFGESSSTLNHILYSRRFLEMALSLRLTLKQRVAV